MRFQRVPVPVVVGAVRVKSRVVWHSRFDLFTKRKRYGALLANTEATTLLGE